MSESAPGSPRYIEALNHQVVRMLDLPHDRHPEFAEDCLHDPWSLAAHWKNEVCVKAVNSVMHSHLVQQDGTVVDDQHDLLGLFSPALEEHEDNIIQVQYRRGRDNTARPNFTLLHELGHYLQQTDDELVTRLFSITDLNLDKKLEEEACNRFAAVALLPTNYVNDVRRGGAIDARMVNYIFEKGREDPDPNIVRVSRPAIVRRMADFLEYPGFVALVQGRKVKVRAHRDGTVSFDDELMAVERTMIDAFHNRKRVKDNDVVKLWTTEEGEPVFSSLALSRSGRQIQYFIVVQFVQ